jgi:hypothetical protein
MDEPKSTKISASERREYFRVEDVLPVVARKVMADLPCNKARILSGGVWGSQGKALELVPDPEIPHRLWKMLCEINSKLDLVANLLLADHEDKMTRDSRKVSISVSGMSFISNEPFEPGDLLEVKLHIPSRPTAWILIYGRVLRVSPLTCGEYELALEFEDLEPDVQDVLSHYTICRQREIILKQREQGQP